MLSFGKKLIYTWKSFIYLFIYWYSIRVVQLTCYVHNSQAGYQHKTHSERLHFLNERFWRKTKLFIGILMKRCIQIYILYIRNNQTQAQSIIPEGVTCSEYCLLYCFFEYLLIIFTWMGLFFTFGLRKFPLRFYQFHKLLVGKIKKLYFIYLRHNMVQVGTIAKPRVLDISVICIILLW